MKDKKIIKIFKKNQWFRAGAGAVILNDQGEVLAFERRDTPGSWQFPQGGLDPNEEPLDAVFREVEEETGIKKKHLQLITTKSKLLAYELPLDFRSGKLNYFPCSVFHINDIILTEFINFSANLLKNESSLVLFNESSIYFLFIRLLMICPYY